MTIVTPARVKLGADEAILQVAGQLTGLPVFIAGSAVAARTHNLQDLAFDDIDVFCGSQNSLIAAAQRLIAGGYTMNERFARVWYRWLKMGFNRWHTNSLKLEGPGGLQVNLVYKLVEGHATTSLAQVIESFDFGLLAAGYECEYDTWRDMRAYLFPGTMPGDALPLMPNKRSNWRQGFISQYNGLREVGRYVKYHDYGFDMSAVKDDLVTGYWASSNYLAGCHEADKQQLGQIYESIAMKIEVDDFDSLRQAHQQIDYKDELDTIMEALE